MNRTIAVLPSLSAPVMNPLKFDGVRTVVPSTSALPAACAYGWIEKVAVSFSSGYSMRFSTEDFPQTNGVRGRWSARS